MGIGDRNIPLSLKSLVHPLHHLGIDERLALESLRIEIRQESADDIDSGSVPPLKVTTVLAEEF